MARIKIGPAASVSGLTVDTLRFYERLGLVSATRLASGYRVFDESVVDRIRLVQELQDLGLTLGEIAGLFEAAKTGDARCSTESGRLTTALRRTEARIAMLLAVRDRLRDAVARCERGDCDMLARAAQTDSRQPAKT